MPSKPSAKALAANKSKHQDVPWTLDQRPRERIHHHRALLLWAMQKETVKTGICGRNLSVVARALGLNQSTVNRLAQQKRWADRLMAHGDDAVRYAQALYRSRYYEAHAENDLPVLEGTIARPLGPLDPDVTDVQEQVVKTLQRLAPPDKVTEETKENVKSKLQEHRERQVKQNRALRGVVMRAITHLNKRLQEGNISARISDLPLIHRLLLDLDEEYFRFENPESALTNNIAIADTVRVKVAKEMGTDVMRAHYEDLLEAKLVFESMFNQQEAVSEVKESTTVTG